jgi:hypothetical protein
MSCNTKGDLCNVMCRSRSCATWRISPARCRGRGRKVWLSGFNTTRSLKCTAVRQEQQEQSRRLHMYIAAQPNYQSLKPPLRVTVNPAPDAKSLTCPSAMQVGRLGAIARRSQVLSFDLASLICFCSLFSSSTSCFCIKSAHAYTILNALDLQLTLFVVLPSRQMPHPPASAKCD